MSNPLATAFQAAAKVRPAIAKHPNSLPGFAVVLEPLAGGMWAWVYKVTGNMDRIDDNRLLSPEEAERLIEAACWRVLPGLSWEDCPGDSPTSYLGSSWYVILNSERRIVGRGPTLALALLAAVAGLGGAE